MVNKLTTSITLLLLLIVGNANAKFKIENIPDGMVVEIPNNLLFFNNTPVLTKSGKKIITSIINKIPKKYTARIIVEGHTDSAAIKDSEKFRYPSNWEMASFSSASVVRYILEKKSKRVTSINLASYGETKPVSPNYTVQGRLDNRRIVLKIIYKEVVKKKYKPIKKQNKTSLGKQLTKNKYLYSTMGACKEIEHTKIHSFEYRNADNNLNEAQIHALNNIKDYILHRGRLISVILESYSKSIDEVLNNNENAEQRALKVKEFMSKNINAQIIKTRSYSRTKTLEKRNNKLDITTVRCLDYYKPLF